MTALSRPDSIRVLLVDSVSVFRIGLRYSIAPLTDLVVVGEGGTARNALALAAVTRPEVALVGIDLPDATGLAVCRRLIAEVPRIAVLVVGDFDWDVYLANAWGLGASGFLLRTDPIDTMIDAIRRSRKGPLFSPGQLDRVSSWNQRVGKRLAMLQPRERDVLSLIAAGRSNREIAGTLVVSEHTVEKHVGSLLKKLGAKSRTGLLALILANHLEALNEYPEPHPAPIQQSQIEEWRISAIDVSES